MARGVPTFLSRRGRKKMAPPQDRNAHIYRDLKAEAEAAEKEAIKAEAAAEGKVAVEVERQAREEDGKFKADDPMTPENEAVEEVVVLVDMGNTKAELLKAAKGAGLEVDAKMTKRMILDAIEGK